jgi:hypothetical protein
MLVQGAIQGRSPPVIAGSRLWQAPGLATKTGH